MKYVYLHRRRSDSKIFFVGLGTGDSAYSKDNRSEDWHKTVQKHGYYVELLGEYDGDIQLF